MNKLASTNFENVISSSSHPLADNGKPNNVFLPIKRFS